MTDTIETALEVYNRVKNGSRYSYRAAPCKWVKEASALNKAGIRCAKSGDTFKAKGRYIYVNKARKEMLESLEGEDATQKLNEEFSEALKKSNMKEHSFENLDEIKKYKIVTLLRSLQTGTNEELSRSYAIRVAEAELQDSPTNLSLVKEALSFSSVSALQKQINRAINYDQLKDSDGDVKECVSALARAVVTARRPRS